MKNLLLYISLLLSNQAIAQSVNHEEVKSRLNVFPTQALKEDIIERIQSVGDFHDFAATPNENDDYIVHEKTYTYDFPLEDVWEAYTNVAPDKIWAGPRVNFAFVYDKNTDRLFFAGDQNIPSLSTGMVVFNHLNLIKLTKMNVSFEITKMDHKNKELQFNYLTCNTAKGNQNLKFDFIDGKTVITHRSLFKNDSKLRDKLYPPAHVLFINEHHKMMEQTLINN